MISEGVPEEDANFYAEGIRRGGSVVAARVDQRRVAETQAILNSFGPVDIERRRASYAEQGWTRFDETADPHTEEQIAAERERYRANRL